MTTFGHSLTGLALLTLAIPAGLSWMRRLYWAMLYIALASIPDWPLPIWGHRQLAVSHSLWVNLVGCAIMVTILWKWWPGGVQKKPLLITGSLAWLSHFALDPLYGDLPGVAINWPFSDGLVSLGLPWLNTLPHVPPPFDAKVVQILGFEFLTFAPLILGAYGLRKILQRKEPPSI